MSVWLHCTCCESKIAENSDTHICICVCVLCICCPFYVIYSSVSGWVWTWPSARMWLIFHLGQKQLSQHQHSIWAYGSVLTERNLPPAYDYMCMCGHRGLIGDDRCGWIIEGRPASPTSICTYVRSLSLSLCVSRSCTQINRQELPRASSRSLSHITVP